MPSKSEKQARTMRAAAHDAEFARKMGIDQDTAREYVKRDQEERDQSQPGHENIRPPYIDW